MKAQKILIVDDDDSHRFMLRCILASWGYSIDEADDGESALQMIGRSDFSLVLMDYRMKKVSGMEVMERLNDGGGRTPVLLMTAYCSEETAKAARDKGAAAVLYKPLHIDGLKDLIRRTIAASQHAGRKTST